MLEPCFELGKLLTMEANEECGIDAADIFGNIIQAPPWQQLSNAPTAFYCAFLVIVRVLICWV